MRDDRSYRDQVDPITRDKRADVIPRSALRRVQIKLDNALAAQSFRLRGDVIFLDRNSTGVIQVQLNNTSEDPFPMAAGDGIEGLPFEDFFVTSAAQPGLVMNVWYGYSVRFRTFLVANDIIDRAARQLGVLTQTIAGTPQGLDKVTDANNAFFGRGGSQTGVGQFGALQIFNPVASGKTVYVDATLVESVAGDSILAYLSNVALTTLLGGTPTASRKGGGAAPSFEMRSQALGGVPGGSFGHWGPNNSLNQAQVPALNPFQQWAPPIELPPGWGLNLIDQTQNQNFEATHFAREY